MRMTTSAAAYRPARVSDVKARTRAAGNVAAQVTCTSSARARVGTTISTT